MAKAFAKSFYKSKAWQQCREYVLMRDRYLCTKCGAPAEEVHHVTHLTQDNITDPTLSINPDNLQSLCKACHMAEHDADRHGKKIDVEMPMYVFDADGMMVPIQ